MSIIDFKPVIDGVVFPTLSAIAVPILTWFISQALYRVSQAAHITVSAKLASSLEVAMQNGIAFALSKAQTYADTHDTVATKQDVIAQAANYVIPKVPKALEKLGVTPAGLAERIEARLPPVPTSAAVSPVAAG